MVEVKKLASPKAMNLYKERVERDMKKIARFSFIMALTLCLGAGLMIGCASDDGGGGGGDQADRNPSVAVNASPIEAGDECPNGGISIDTGIDDNGNGVLDLDEVDETQVVCNGEDGVDGGLITLISITDEDPGDNCADGGKKIEVGVDNDGDGELGSDEVDETHYVCNGEDGIDGQDGQGGQDGQDGADGTDGLTTLISITDEASGDNCPNGGIKVDVGLDHDGDGILDPEEIDDTAYVCDGNDAPATLISVSDAGESCTNGGKKVEVGIDNNDDGVLDPEEVDDTWYVCNGEDGQDGQDGLTSLISITDEGPGDNCPNGGKKIEVGVDDNANGVLDSDPNEVSDTAYVCNGAGGDADGLTSLISINKEPAGLNCADGGIKIEVGLDDDRDRGLNPEEVDSTNYVCHGGDILTYTVGGTVSGLNGTVVLRLNDGDDLDITADGAFTFSTVFHSGAIYNVTVATQPANQTCTVVNGKGKIPGANVTGVLVFCSEFTYGVGGTVSGLTGTVTLQNNGGDDLDVTAEEFTFATELADGSSYNVTVLTHPVAQTCSVTANGGGDITSADVTNVKVDCVEDITPPTVDLTFPMNGDDDIALDTNIAATFSEPMVASTITTDTFTLYDVTASTSVNGTVSYDSNSNTAIFDPDDDLTIAHEYTATITTGATDLAHNPLEDDYPWSFTAIDVSCTTTVDSGLVAGQTWTVDGSPYCVTGDIQVSLLTIEPGVEVLVDGPYEIEVLSTITAIGTEEDPILFSSKKPTEPTNQRWKGIKFQNTPSGSEFTHAIIEYSDDSGITLIESTPDINNCTIRNNTSPGHGGGINAVLSTEQTLSLIDSIFENNTANPSQANGNYVGGALYLAAGDAIIKNGQFIGNRSNSKCYGRWDGCNTTARGGAIYISGTGNVTVENSNIRENHTDANSDDYCFSGMYSRSYGAGVFVNSGTVTLTNVVLSGNTMTTRGCVGPKNGSGLYVNGGLVTVINSTISRNFDATGVHVVGGTLDILNSIIYFNNADGTQVGGTPTITYSDVQGGYEGEGNINLHPAFVGTGYEASDLELAIGSSAIDAGNLDPIYDDVCFPPSHDTARNDMGAYGGPLACDW